MKQLLLFTISLTCFLSRGQHISGTVYDNDALPLIGATIHLTESNQYTTSGMDGSFKFQNVGKGNYTLTISYIGFTTYSSKINIQDTSVHIPSIKLTPNTQTLESFEFTAKSDGATIAGARIKEKNSAVVMNVTSSEAIRLSPDNNVNEVIQRVSGVTLESDNNGTGESFAIIRGMPKRYNYSLVNGIKIPSSDNKNRFVSLDLFPSDLLERLEVVKTLTPSMEGDAVGGAINMVMRKAPEKKLFLVNAFFGYHTLLFDQSFQNFDASAINAVSPFEKYGPHYKATSSDFTTENLESNEKDFAPNGYLSLSYGHRFLKNKLGLMLSGTYNKTHSITNSVRFEPGVSADGESKPVLTEMAERTYFNDVTQWGFNTSVDFNLNKNHQIKLSGLFLDLNNNQLRNQTATRLWGVSPGDKPVKSYSQRFRKTQRTIYNATLEAQHKLSEKWDIDWKAAYSKAKKQRPDHAVFATVSNYSLNEGTESVLVAEDGDNSRDWEYNTDTDLTGILNIKYHWNSNTTKYNLQFGGLYRNKKRNSFIVGYNFNPDPGIQAYGYDWTPDDPNITEYGTWERYSDISFRLRNPQGSTRNELNQNAHQHITAGYVQMQANISELYNIIGGVRIENTDQGYELLAPRAGQEPISNNVYTDILPSLAIKYALNEKSNIRASYFYSIIRPGYFEIVPYFYRQEDYVEMGNRDLKKIRTHNLDLRYETFGNATGQFLFGVFYKQINDPIEYVLTNGKDHGVNAIVRRPDNFNVAINTGAEVNYIKYVKEFGIKLNYSFTHSEVTSEKSLRQRADADDPSSDIITTTIPQTRPLQGQAAHIGNIALLYKGAKNGINAQVAFNYTGERIRTVSNYYNNDEWEKAFYQLDISAEKTFSKKWQVYLKVRNLLNSQYQTFIKQPVNAENANFPYQGNTGDNVITGQEEVGLNFRIGFRYNM